MGLIFEDPVRDVWHWPVDQKELDKGGGWHGGTAHLYMIFEPPLGVVYDTGYTLSKHAIAAWGKYVDTDKYWVNEDHSPVVYTFDTEQEAQALAVSLARFQQACGEPYRESRE